MTGKPPILMRREGNRLAPIDAWSEEQVLALPQGITFNVRTTEDRSRSELNLYWAGLGYLRETAVDDLKWPTTRKLHRTIMEALGYVERIYRIDGSYWVEPDSIALNEMEDAEFKTYFERAKTFVWLNWHVDPWAEWLKEKQASNPRPAR